MTLQDVANRLHCTTTEVLAIYLLLACAEDEGYWMLSDDLRQSATMAMKQIGYGLIDETPNWRGEYPDGSLYVVRPMGTEDEDEERKV